MFHLIAKENKFATIIFTVCMIIMLLVIGTIYIGLGLILIYTIYKLISNLKNKRKIKNIKPSTLICPVCNSKDIIFKTNKNFNINEDLLVYKNHYNTYQEAVCKKCNYTYPFITEKDLNANFKQIKNNIYIHSILSIISIIALILFTFMLIQ